MASHSVFAFNSVGSLPQACSAPTSKSSWLPSTSAGSKTSQRCVGDLRLNGVSSCAPGCAGSGESTATSPAQLLQRRELRAREIAKDHGTGAAWIAVGIGKPQVSGTATLTGCKADQPTQSSAARGSASAPRSWRRSRLPERRSRYRLETTHVGEQFIGQPNTSLSRRSTIALSGLYRRVSRSETTDEKISSRSILDLPAPKTSIISSN